MNITEFLLARIAEDEVAARAASPGGWQYGTIESVAGGTLYDESRRIADLTYEQIEDHDGTIVRHLLSDEANANGAHIARHDPARVLAECEAKRRIVEAHPQDPVTGCDTCDWQPWRPGSFREVCPTLRALAAVWVDHRDYDPAWRDAGD